MHQIRARIDWARFFSSTVVCLVPNGGIPTARFFQSIQSDHVGLLRELSREIHASCQARQLLDPIRVLSCLEVR